jgi:hypothetical protein
VIHKPHSDDAVRLVTAVIARGPDSELAQAIATAAVAQQPPVDFAVDVADIAAESLEALAAAEGEDKQSLLQQIAEGRDPISGY